VTLGDRGERQAVRKRGGKILERVDGDIDPAVEQRFLDFPGEKAFALELVQRAIDLGIALRLDHDQLRRHTLLRQAGAHPVRLPARELAAASADLHANRLTSDPTNPGMV